MQGLNILGINTGTFNAVRCGPMSVTYEYTGRLDNSSGNVTMGKQKDLYFKVSVILLRLLL
jgi:hypothetical protein